MEKVDKKRAVIAVIVTLCITALIILGYWISLNDHKDHQEKQESIDLAHVAKIRNALEQCRHDMDSCAGGFFKWKGNKSSLNRLGYCYNNCNNHEISLVRTNDYFKVNQADINFEEVEFVVLPNDPEWNLMAVTWSKQFIRKTKTKN